jgi:tetratricopeptide (TPR) repeat protein
VIKMKISLLTFLIALMTCLPFVYAQDKGNRQWWVNSYGEVTREHMLEIDRATAIFDHIWNSAQPTTIKKPRLLFLPESAEKWIDSWAISIADGSIIMVESLLPLAFDVGSRQRKFGDSRLAFVLSHELAHLIHKDHETLGVPLLFQALTSETDLQEARQIEISADYKGLFIMTMAGYNPRNVLQTDSTFFNEYALKVRKKIRSIGNNKKSNRHPESAVRAEELRVKLMAFADHLQLFYKGVDAYQNQKLDKAEQAFRDFMKVYPGRETLNNLGLTLYQKARTYISGCSGIHYKLIPATQLVTRTDADLLVPEQTRISVEIKKQPSCRPDLFQKMINKAGKMLQLAREKDQTYKPVLVNLTALQITRRKYRDANHASGNLLAQSADPHALNNKALALYLLNAKQNQKESVQLLKNVSNKSPVYKLASRNLRLISGGKLGLTVTPLNVGSEIDHEILESIE